MSTGCRPTLSSHSLTASMLASMAKNSPLSGSSAQALENGEGSAGARPRRPWFGAASATFSVELGAFAMAAAIRAPASAP